MEKIIEFKNLRKSYPNGVVAVDNLFGEFEMGKFYAIMGHSGSGKTTLLQMLGLLLNSTQGEIIINGTDVSKLNYFKLRKINLSEVVC